MSPPNLYIFPTRELGEMSVDELRRFAWLLQCQRNSCLTYLQAIAAEIQNREEVTTNGPDSTKTM